MPASRYSFSLDNPELEDWMEEMHEEGSFRNRSHVIEEALKRMKKGEVTVHEA